jgi:TfoX/Sxy family transcriptional regulator of competence genes
MFGCPAYFVNNNMFTGAFQDYIFLRLSEKDRNKLSESYDEATPFEPMQGRVMKEYMVVPETLYNDEVEFNTWLKLAYDYASKIPPKKKRVKAKKKNKD